MSDAGQSIVLRGLGVVSVAIIVAGAAQAGPDWEEGADGGGDAGSLPGGAQVVTGEGPVSSLTGSLSGTEGSSPGDFEDLFLLRIDDFASFDISTSPGAGVAPAFDTILYLFTGPGHPLGAGVGLLANDDDPNSVGGASRLTGSPTSAVPQGFLPDPPLFDGLSYFIGISGKGNVPIDANGDELFSFDSLTEVTLADGLGGDNPIAGWTGVGEVGVYGLPDMIGTSFIPAPGAAISLLACGGAALLRRRR